MHYESPSGSEVSEVSCAFGQRLTDTPAFARWKQAGWYVTWQHRKIEQGEWYLSRPAQTEGA